MYGFVLFPLNQRSSLRKEMKVQDSQTIQTKILDKLPEGCFFFFFMKMWHRRGLPGDSGACISSCGTILFRNRGTIRLGPARLPPELVRGARGILPVCILGKRLAGSGSVLWWREDIKTSWRNWTPWRGRFRGKEHEHSSSSSPSHPSGPS